MLHADREQVFDSGQGFPLAALGPFRPCEPAAGLPADVWEEVWSAQISPPSTPPSVPDDVLTLVEARQAARARHDWAAADALRNRIAAIGWSVQNTPEGPRLESAKS